MVNSISTSIHPIHRVALAVQVQHLAVNVFERKKSRAKEDGLKLYVVSNYLNAKNRSDLMRNKPKINEKAAKAKTTNAFNGEKTFQRTAAQFF